LVVYLGGEQIPWNGTGAALLETALWHNGLIGGATPRKWALRVDKAELGCRQRQVEEVGWTRKS